MLSSTIIGIMFGAGVATWIFNKVMHRTGNNTKSALIVGGMAGLFGFILVVTVMSMINSATE